MITRYCLVFLAILSQAIALDIVSKQPDQWSLRITTDARERGLIYVVDVNCHVGLEPELVIRKGEAKAPIREYDLLYSGNLTKKDAALAWDGFSDMLHKFTLVDEPPRYLDGGFFMAELKVGNRSIQIRFDSLLDTKEAGVGLNNLLEIAKARLAVPEKLP